MKVRNVSSYKLNNVAVTEDKKGLQNVEESFESHLKDISGTNMSESLKTLAGNITMQGELVCKMCDIKELKKYKSMISSFLKEAVNYCYEFDKDSQFNSLGRHRVYANVKKINDKLSVLTEEVLNCQKDPIKILKNVDEIKGLILDMLL